MPDNPNGRSVSRPDENRPSAQPRDAVVDDRETQRPEHPSTDRGGQGQSGYAAGRDEPPDDNGVPAKGTRNARRE